MQLDYQSLVRSFDEDGFVVIRGLYSSEEIAELQAQIDRYIVEVVPTLPPDTAFYDDYDKPETLRKMQWLDRHDPWFADFMNNGKHIPLLEHLLRDRFSPQSLEWFDKLPFDTNATPPHQDNFYWCRRPDNACSLWIALEPVDRDNGCLHYARGSHRQGVLPHVPSGVLGFSQGIEDFNADTVDDVLIELDAGDAVAHHAAVIHWTDVNRSPRHRRALSTFCFGASTTRDEDAFGRYQLSLKEQLARRGIAMNR